VYTFRLLHPSRLVRNEPRTIRNLSTDGVRVVPVTSTFVNNTNRQVMSLSGLQARSTTTVDAVAELPLYGVDRTFVLEEPYLAPLHIYFRQSLMQPQQEVNDRKAQNQNRRQFSEKLEGERPVWVSKGNSLENFNGKVL
jgi:hypothetical protein